MSSVFDLNNAGDAIYTWCEELFPICRSITGKGVRQTLEYLSSHVSNLVIHSVPSGTQVFDWTIPLEWNIEEAYIETSDGTRIIDFSNCNLHVVGYSIAVDKIVNYEELCRHLYTLPDNPGAIPYVTSYYQERWGFCIEYEKFSRLDQAIEYRVVIKSSHTPGCLNYGELFIPSTCDTKEEILLSSYICHPSLANNELSGPCVLLALAKWLESLEYRRYNYRIVFVPETIGSITFLSLQDLDSFKKRVVGGYNLTCLGDDRAYSLLPSRCGDTTSDQIANYVAKEMDPNYIKYDWKYRGSDERQYCSPNVDLPIATLCRTLFGFYPEYHTSLDRLGTVVTKEGLCGGFRYAKKCLDIFEKNIVLKSNIYCEPQLGKRKLYPTLSFNTDGLAPVNHVLDILSMADGKMSLLDIAEFYDIPFSNIASAAQIILDQNLASVVS